MVFLRLCYVAPTLHQHTFAPLLSRLCCGACWAWSYPLSLVFLVIGCKSPFTSLFPNDHAVHNIVTAYTFPVPLLTFPAVCRSAATTFSTPPHCTFPSTVTYCLASWPTSPGTNISKYITPIQIKNLVPCQTPKSRTKNYLHLGVCNCPPPPPSPPIQRGLSSKLAEMSNATSGRKWAKMGKKNIQYPRLQGFASQPTSSVAKI